MKSRRLKKYKLKTIMTVITVLAVLITAATYAWFSANRAVTISDITAKVVASEGMQVSLDGILWGAVLEINGETLGLTQNNLYSWPDELVPVSTGGTSSNGRLNLKYGSINQDEAYLEGISTEADETTNKYVSFDLYIKNSTGDELGNNMKLSAGSLVRINENGEDGTGLENSIRVGFVIYSNTASITADSAEVLALTAGDTPNVVIWEPNYNLHIGEVINNDRRISSGVEDFTSWGINMNASSTVYQADTPDGKYYADDAVHGITVGTTNTYLSNPSTIKTDAELGADLDITNVLGNTVLLAPNTVTKARVYVWLEGQDPDCINTASTGKVIDVMVNLSK